MMDHVKCILGPMEAGFLSKPYEGKGPTVLRNGPGKSGHVLYIGPKFCPPGESIRDTATRNNNTNKEIYMK